MTAQPLPKKLNKEPLIDAVFELRFSSSTAASNILPGFFYAKLKPEKWQIETLPVAEIPSQVRNLDPNFRYQPLKRIQWDDFVFLIGDAVLGVGCRMPYPGWDRFKAQITKMIELLAETNIVQNIERYSLKYVNLIEGENLAELVPRIELALKVGGQTINQERFTVRVEIPHGIFLTIIQIVAPVTVTKTNDQGKQEHDGILLDIDTLCGDQVTDLKNFINDLGPQLEAIHLESKQMFFNCLTLETVDYLEPVYE